MTVYIINLILFVICLAGTIIKVKSAPEESATAILIGFICYVIPVLVEIFIICSRNRKNIRNIKDSLSEQILETRQLIDKETQTIKDSLERELGQHKTCDLIKSLQMKGESFPALMYRIEQIHDELEEMRRKNQFYLESLQQVYLMDIKILKELSRSAKVRATVPMPDNPSMITKHLNQLADFNYISELKEKAKNLKIMRLYLFKNEDLFNLAEVQQHLKEMAGSNIELRYRFDEDLPPGAGRQTHQDLVIFGNKVVSKEVHHNKEVGGTVYNFSCEEKEIGSMIQSFDKLWNKSTEFTYTG